MGVAKRTRKFAAVKRMIGQRDSRLKKNSGNANSQQAAAAGVARGLDKSRDQANVVREIPQQPSHMFFAYNEALAPPYQVLLDTNFLSHSIRAKLDVTDALMDCLYATVNPCITDCVMAELEKLGPKYRLALQTARDPRFTRLTCDHKGVYADDCIHDRCAKNRIYIVGTNDRDLKRRIRKIPGVPLISVGRGKYAVERLPDAPEK